MVRIILIVALFMLPACSLDETKDVGIFSPEVLLRQAEAQIKDGDYETARQTLERIISKDTTGRYAPLAQLLIANTYYDDGMYEEAAQEYETFLKAYPYHRYAQVARYRLAMSYFKRIKTVDVSYTFAKRALEEFQRLKKEYPRNPYMDIVESRIEICRDILARYEFYVGSFYFKKGSYRAAIGRFREVLQRYPGSTSEPDALYYLGISYKELGMTEQAVDTLRMFLERYPASERSVEVRMVLRSLNRPGE